METELNQTRWSLEEDESRMGSMVVSVIDDLVEDQKPRRSRAKANLQSYLGHSVTDLNARTYARPAGDKDIKGITLRIAQSVVDTGKAKIASRQRPKPVVVTKGGNYAQRVRARKKTKFLEAQLHRAHGMYANAWQLMEQVFKDCELWEAGVVKVVADTTENRPVLERCFSFDIYFDDFEAEYGCPKNLFHRYRFDRHNLAARFPEYHDAIMGAEEYEVEGFHRRNRDMVAIYEAWRLPFGPDKPGRHTIVIKTAKSGGESGSCVLVDEEWVRSEFPFYFMTWERHQFGLWGMPLIEQIAEPQEEANQTFSYIQEQVQLGGTGFLEIDHDGHEMDDALSNEAWHVVRRINPNAPPIKIHSPPAFNQSVLQWAETMKALCYELPGVSEMSAQGKKEAGVTAGVAIRAVNDLATERFLPKAKDYENSFVAIGKLMLWAMEDLADDDNVSNADLLATLPSGDTLQEFGWDDVKLDDYEVQMQPASSFPDTPAGRLQAISEFAQAGYIGPDTARRLMSQAAPDIDAVNERDTAQYRYIEMILSEMQESEEGEDFDSPSPDPLLDLEAAIMQMTLGYYEMMRERAPEHNLSLCRNWIQQADDILAKAATPPEPEMAPPMDPMTDPGAMPPEGMLPEMMGPPPEELPPEMMPAI